MTNSGAKAPQKRARELQGQLNRWVNIGPYVAGLFVSLLLTVDFILTLISYVAIFSQNFRESLHLLLVLIAETALSAGTA